MDRDVNALDVGAGQDGQQGYRWRSREVERRRFLEVSGVFAAARHGRWRGLANTLGICLIALAAVGAMVTLGWMREQGTFDDNPTTIVAPANSDTISVVSEPNTSDAEEFLDNMALTALVGVEAQPSAPALEANRANCASIQGTPYESELERTWFLANCIVEQEPEPLVFASAPASGSIASDPIAAPEPAEGINEEIAITAGADYIAGQSNPSYDVASGSCNASPVGELWLVTCQATLTGCETAECTSWEAVCVVDSAGVVLSSRNC